MLAEERIWYLTKYKNHNGTTKIPFKAKKIKIKIDIKGLFHLFTMFFFLSCHRREILVFK